MNRTNMIRFATLSTIFGLLSVPALASSAETSASAGRDRLGRGNTQATASYEGNRGFARTDSRTGRVNVARGVAVGVDEDGLSLSVSHAIDRKNGPSIATNFNLSIGRDGASHSNGLSVAGGSRERQASAGGAVSNHRHNPVAISTASGRTGSRGQVIARTNSYVQRQQPRVLRPIRRAPRVIVHEGSRRVPVRESRPVRRLARFAR